MIMQLDENGQRWARNGLLFGILASVVGNIANAYLTETPVSLGLRVPLAVIWPIGMFLAIEVLVRNRHVRGALARVGQGALLTVSIPTAVTSFVNLHGLMVKANEPGIAQLSGPLAIDGLMLGCTVMLLAARAHIIAPEITIAPDVTESVEALIEESIPISPSPVRTRRPRAQWDAAKVVDMIADGETTQAIHDATDASSASIDRMRRVYRTLTIDPRATIDSVDYKVSPERVALIRGKVGM
jgi:hypothetical protein